ncbi:MAG: hypothetical protein IPL46_22240 [Saprospiraceae bacterium]|nr:hypothetical protein [Saprospiraceae bacterium]
MTDGNNEFYHSANTYNDLSLYYKKSGQLDSSIYYAEKGLDVANRISYTQGILSACKILAEQYELNDSRKALYYFKLATENQGKLYGAGNIQIMSDMIAKDEARRQQIQMTEINYRNRLKQYLLLAGLFTILVVAIILFRNYWKSKASNLILENTLSNLKATQGQLIQSEKMASLGELTAGIAHEIQNPLNFVNNFSEVSGELIAEARDELEKGDIKEAKEILTGLSQNLEKINHHGQRASSIVKGMLDHSRSSAGEKIPTDINQMCDEYLRLAYHGMRAKDKSFNVDFKTEFDESIPKISVIPQDIGRVILNLVNNGFQALSDVALAKSDPDYKPTVSVSTKLSPAGGGAGGGQLSMVQITISDNGPGIPDDIKDKIFQPFFTTKPAGQGTGLGLSLSYDIVKAHGGELKVETKEGEGCNFMIYLPVGTE